MRRHLRDATHARWYRLRPRIGPMLICPCGGSTVTHQPSGRPLAIAMMLSASRADNDLATLGQCLPDVGVTVVILRSGEIWSRVHTPLFDDAPRARSPVATARGTGVSSPRRRSAGPLRGGAPRRSRVGTPSRARSSIRQSSRGAAARALRRGSRSTLLRGRAALTSSLKRAGRQVGTRHARA